MNYNKAMVRASAHFLTDQLPDDWYEMTDEEIKKFLYMTTPFEYSDTGEIFDAIQALAIDFQNVWNECKKAHNIGLTSYTFTAQP